MLRKSAIAFIVLPSLALAGQLDYSFNSPTFNGQGYGTYELTIKQLQDQHQATYQAQQEAIKQAAETAAEQATATAKASALAKLTALGLTQAEVTALIG